MFNQFLSFEDLKHLEGWDKAWKEGDIKEVEKLLYKAGCDTEFGWSIVVVNHRPRTSNLPVYSPRFQFVERRDREWEKSGMMSTEDIIENCTDPLLRAEMKMLSQRSKNTAEILEWCAKNSPEDIDEDFKEKK